MNNPYMARLKTGIDELCVNNLNLKYATRNATQNKINAFVMRIYRGFIRVQFPSAPPNENI